MCTMQVQRHVLLIHAVLSRHVVDHHDVDVRVRVLHDFVGTWKEQLLRDHRKVQTQEWHAFVLQSLTKGAKVAHAITKVVEEPLERVEACAAHHLQC